MAGCECGWEKSFVTERRPGLDLGKKSVSRDKR